MANIPAVEQVSRSPTTFHDLPGELRNEIYAEPLRFETERNLKLKLKFGADGQVHLKEPNLALCHADPCLRNELLSMYYSLNRFRIVLVTPAQREAFRAWVFQRGPLLRHLKALRLACAVSNAGRVEIWSVKLAVSETTGELEATHSFKQYGPYDRVEGDCCVLRAFTEDQRHSSRSSADSESGSRSEPNPVVGFALKLCRALDYCDGSDRKTRIWKEECYRDERSPRESCEAPWAMFAVGRSRPNWPYIYH